MRTREKVVVIVLGATLILGALIFLAFRENEVEANYLRWLLANNFKLALSSPGGFLDELPSGTLLYGGLTIFAVVMAIVVLKMIRDGEIQALRRHLFSLRAEKNEAESLLQEVVWKGKHDREAKDSVRKDLESSIGKIESLLEELNEKERLLRARDSELMAAKSSVGEYVDSGSSKDPAERLLRDELRKKNEILQGKDSIVKDLEQRLSAKTRLWENQIREKDALLKGRDQELGGLQTEIVDLVARLAEMEGAKKRVEDLLQDELRQKQEVLEASDLAVKADEKRLNEKIRSLENQLSEREKLLRTHDTVLNGIRRQVGELESAKDETERRLQAELEKFDHDRHARDNIINDLEQRLGSTIQALQTEVGEKDLLLQARDGELKTLQSEMNSISHRLSEMAAAKVRTEESLQEELRREKQQREAERTARREIEEHHGKEIEQLTAQLVEKNESVKSRDGEINALKHEISAVTLRLNEINIAKERAETSLREELQKEKQQREAKQVAGREFEERYSKEVQSLQSQLGEKDRFLTSRNEEIKGLRVQVESLAEQLAKVGSAKERAASLLQEKVRKERESLQATDSAIKEIEESFKARIDSLEDELSAKKELVGNRDREVAALTSEMSSLNQSLAELKTAKEHAESLFRDAIKERGELLQSADAGARKLEEDLSGKIRRLESQLSEKEELLNSRESDLDNIKNQLAALATSKDQAAGLLHEDIKHKTELLETKDAAIKTLEERFSARIHSLENDLDEKQELLQAREAELKTLLSKANTLSGELVELGSSKDHAARLLQEGLREKSELLESKESAMKALEERLTGRVRSLEDQVSQKQDLLAARDTELDALQAKVSELTEKLSELGGERERSDRLLQEKLREKTALLQSNETSMDALEERLKTRTEALERQVAEKQKLLEASCLELNDLRALMNGMTERLNEVEAAKVSLEGLLQEERRSGRQAPLATEPSEPGASQDAKNGEAHNLDTLLSEREQLLKARDKLIHDLMGELKEKKTQLARQEIDVWQKIERREAWKHRLSKIGIRIKD
jgi:chromosome segregation ATPase